MSARYLRPCTAVLLAIVVSLGASSPAAAQVGPAVTIDFEVGDFAAAEGDWPITVVNVSGDPEPDEVFVVELRAGAGGLVWAGGGGLSPPPTSVAVDPFVAR